MIYSFSYLVNLHRTTVVSSLKSPDERFGLKGKENVAGIYNKTIESNSK